MTQRGLLRCTISDGLFPEEKTVVFRTADSQHVELFAPTNVVKDDQLEITILEEDESRVLVRLPVAPTVGGLMVVVPAKEVTRAVSA